MKGFVLVLIAAAVLAFLFFSFISFVGKTMKPSQRQDNRVTVSTADMLSDQRNRMELQKEQQKRLMEENKRRLDMMRRR